MNTTSDSLGEYIQYYVATVANPEAQKVAWESCMCDEWFEDLVDEWDSLKEGISRNLPLKTLVDNLVTQIDNFSETIDEFEEGASTVEQYIRRIQSSPTWLNIEREARKIIATSGLFFRQ